MSRNNKYFGVDEKYQPANGKSDIVSNNQVEGYGVRKRRVIRIGKFVIGAGLLYAILVISFAIIMMVLFFSLFRGMFSTASGFIGDAGERQQQMNDDNANAFEDTRDTVNNMREDGMAEFENFSNNMENQRDKNNHNFPFVQSVGTKVGTFVLHTIDDVISNHKQVNAGASNGILVSVIFDNKETTDPVELVNIKSSIDTWTDYEVSIEYNGDGYIYQITIDN